MRLAITSLRMEAMDYENLIVNREEGVGLIIFNRPQAVCLSCFQ